MLLFLLSIIALRVDNPPVIDGILEETVWKKAAFVDSFIQSFPDDSGNASLKTSFAILYDDKYLYIGVKCFQDSSKILYHITRRDRMGRNNDWIIIKIDPEGRGRGGYFFSVTPSGSVGDGYIGNYMDYSWDGIWDVKTHIDSTDWTSEFRIPFSIMRLGEEGRVKMKINIVRKIAYLDETDEYPFIPAEVNNPLVCYAPVKGITGIYLGIRTTLIPYLRIGYTPKFRDFSWSAGLDNQIKFGPNLILDTSFNPDFCQVEADPHILNLSTYEMYFPEHRPFFIEGKEMFQSNPQIFYSRRIGKLDYFYSPDSILTMPEAATILSAFKLTSKKGKTQTGILYALTDEEYAELMDSTGKKYRELIQPMRHYGVITERWDITDESYIRIMNATGLDNSLFGGMAWLIDTKLPIRKNLSLSSSFTLSYKDSIMEASPGKAIFLNSTYSGRWYNIVVSGNYIDTIFDVNATGFNTRNNKRGISGTFSMWNTKRFSIFSSIFSFLHLTYSENLKGEPVDRYLFFNNSITFSNKHHLFIGGNYNPPRYDDLLTRGGPPVHLPESYGFSIFYSTDRTRIFAIRIVHNYSKTGKATYKNSGASLMGAPSSLFSFRLSLNLTKENSPYMWITNEVDSTGSMAYVFGDIDRKSYTFEVRSGLNPTSMLSFQVWTRAYIDRGIYTHIKRLDDPKIPSFTDWQLNYDPDFFLKSIQIHTVLRWEYKKGSVFYLVWTKDLYDYANKTVENIDPLELKNLYFWHGGNKISAKLTYRVDI